MSETGHRRALEIPLRDLYAAKGAFVWLALTRVNLQELSEQTGVHEHRPLDPTHV